jgi:hypothetical protein
MVNSAFGVAMGIILTGYGIYYAVNFIKDIFFDKSGEVVQEAAVQEQEVDIGDELKDFTKFNANENEAEVKARKEAEEAARRREEDGVEYGDPGHDTEASEASGEEAQASEGDSSETGQLDAEGAHTSSEETEETAEESESPETPAGADAADAGQTESESTEEAPSDEDSQGKEVVDDFNERHDFGEVEAAINNFKKENLPELPTMTGGIEADDFNKKFDFSGVEYAVEKVKSAA